MDPFDGVAAICSCVGNSAHCMYVHVGYVPTLAILLFLPFVLLLTFLCRTMGVCLAYCLKFKYFCITYTCIVTVVCHWSISLCLLLPLFLLFSQCFDPLWLCSDILWAKYLHVSPKCVKLSLLLCSTSRRRRHKLAVICVCVCVCVCVWCYW